jgi:hypothetical protein
MNGAIQKVHESKWFNCCRRHAPDNQKRYASRKGADPNKVTRWELHPRGSVNTDLVALLLKHDANVNCRDWEGAPALVAAMSFPTILDMLLSRGVDCQVAFMSPKLNSIEWAIESGNVALVQRLLGHGVPLEVFLEAARVRMILIAAATGRVFMLQFLRQYGVIPVPSNEEAQSAMRSAMRRGDSKPQNISSIKDLTRLTRPLNEGLVTKTATTTTTAPDLTWEMLLKLSTLKRQKRPLTYFCVMVRI